MQQNLVVCSLISSRSHIQFTPVDVFSHLLGLPLKEFRTSSTSAVTLVLTASLAGHRGKPVPDVKPFWILLPQEIMEDFPSVL